MLVLRISSFSRGLILLPEHVNMDGGAAGYLEREKPCRVPFLRNENLGMGHDAVLEIGLRKVPLRVRNIKTLCLPEPIENMSDSPLPEFRRRDPFVDYFLRYLHSLKLPRLKLLFALT